MINKNVKPCQPAFSEQDVRRMAKRFYGLDNVSVKRLVSYIDFNFYLQDETGREFVFKIANSLERKEIVEAQNLAMQHMSTHQKRIKCPEVFTTLKDKTITTVKSSAGSTHLVRLLSFLPGTFWGELQAHPPELLENLGQVLGEMTKAFKNFFHPVLHRYFQWDLRNTMDLADYADYLKNPEVQRLVEYFIRQFKTFVVPAFPKLRSSVIHNDANDFNLLVNMAGETPAITGIIDFGDMMYTYTVNELAVAIAYAIHRKPDPIETAALIIGSYHTVFPLEELEVEVLFYLICARLCATLLISSYQLQLAPHNEYLKISMEPAREALEKLIRINPDHAVQAFRKACNMPIPPDKGLMPPGKILESRKKHIGRNMSVSYREPLKIVRGAMQYLYDHTGSVYLDTVNNVCHVGHCHPRVVEAAQKQMAILNTNTRYLHDHIVEYAQRLCDLLPEPLSVCYFVNSGSEANELALRLARTHTGKTDFIVIDQAYHGNTNDIIEISPYKFDGPGGAGAPPHVHKVMIPDVYRGPYKSNDSNSGEKYALDVKRVIDELQNKNIMPAAFIHEPLMSVAGQIVLPDRYLKEAYRYTRDAGGICIADEVQVGFGRVGTHMWAFATQDVVPDIVTMGKPIGNGHPLAAVVTTPGIADSFHNGMEYFNTFGGNPVSCAVGLAVLDVIRDEQLQQHALQVGNHMKTGLKQLMDKYSLIGDVRGMGLFLGIELVLDRETLEPAKEKAYDIAERMKEEGILISIDGPLYNVIKIKPPLVFTRANADEYIETLDRIMAGG